MSNVEQFKKAVADAGAVAIRVIRRPEARSVWSFRR